MKKVSLQSHFTADNKDKDNRIKYANAIDMSTAAVAVVRNIRNRVDDITIIPPTCVHV